MSKWNFKQTNKKYNAIFNTSHNKEIGTTLIKYVQGLYVEKFKSDEEIKDLNK